MAQAKREARTVAKNIKSKAPRARPAKSPRKAAGKSPARPAAATARQRVRAAGPKTTMPSRQKVSRRVPVIEHEETLDVEVLDDISLSELSSVLDEFESALGGAGNNPAQTIRYTLVQFQGQGNQLMALVKSGHRQARQTYERVVSALRHAADQGEDLAQSILLQLEKGRNL